MRIETVLVSGFRSIECSTLSDCGNFNVIIGKNNAGKSNILSAISTFFKYLRNGEPVHLIQTDTLTEHYERRLASPIELSIGFQLTQQEHDELARDVVSYAPQIKNTLDTLNADLRLRVRLTVLGGTSQAFAFVRQIAMCTKDDCQYIHGHDGRVVLEIGDSAAEELAARAARSQTNSAEIHGISQTIETLSRLDSDDWRRFKAEPALRYFRMRVDPALSRDSIARIDTVIKSSETASAARDSLLALITARNQEVDALRAEPLKNRISSLSGEESSVPAYALSLLRRLGDKKVLYLTERRDPIGRREAAQLLELKVKRGGPEKLRSIQETVNALLGVEIDAFQAEESSREQQGLAAELDVDRFLVQANGAGIREALRLILDYEFEKPSLLLVEEPEIHLHPALETSMMRFLKGIADCQVFLTTHSTNFLDTADMRNVYLALRETQNGSESSPTRIQLLNATEAETTIPRELGIRLSSLFMFDRLVFVEGPSDEDVIREWASLLSVNLAHASVGFVPMGGARNLAHFAAKSTIAFLSKRQVRTWFILDRDERDDQEVRRLSGSLGPQSKLIVLHRREIENYLIVPSAIAKFVGYKRGLAGTSPDEPSVTEVENALEEQANDLKETALTRRIAREICAPIYPDREVVLHAESSGSVSDRAQAELLRLRSHIDTLLNVLNSRVDEHSRLLDREWESRKKEIVPGDELIDRVCIRFGVRFNKERDGGRLAGFMAKDEIAGEIATMLREITR